MYSRTRNTFSTSTYSQAPKGLAESDASRNLGPV